MTDSQMPPTTPAADEDTIVCTACGAKHDRYYMEGGIRTTWQQVGLNAHSEFLGASLVSLNAEVCRDERCAIRWIEDQAPALAALYAKASTEKQQANTIQAKIEAGRLRGLAPK